MTSMLVRIDRLIYINRIRDEQKNGERQAKVLPRGKRPLMLTSVSFSEREFASFAPRMVALMNNPDVEGIYEKEVSPLFRFLVELGSSIRFSPSGAVHAGDASHVFSLSDFASSSSSSSLSRQRAENNPVKNVRKVFVYSCLLYSQPMRGSVAVIGKALDGSLQASVILLQPFASQQVPRINVAEMMKERLADASVDAFPLMVVSSIDDLHQRVDNAIMNIIGSAQSPRVICFQGSINNLSMLKAGRTLFESSPVVHIPVPESDLSLPALNWIPTSVKTAVSRVAALTLSWATREQFCNFAHVPVGNASSDLQIFSADVIFARLLRKENYVMWASDGLHPDLGGMQDDVDFFSEEERQIQVCVPSFYGEVCVELDLGHLDINTILCSAVDVEHGAALDLSAMMNESAAGAGYANGTDSGSANEQKLNDLWCLPILKMFSQALIMDAVQHKSQTADALLMSFFRWLRSPHSLFHDDALFRSIRRLMKQLFLRLCVHLRKQGLRIVYASFHKLILATGKSDVTDGLRYVENVLKHVKSLESFRLLEAHVSNVFQQLLFVDAKNYAGFAAQQSGTPVDDEDTSVMRLQYLSHWNIVKTLPQALQNAVLCLLNDMLGAVLGESQKLFDSQQVQDDAAVANVFSTYVAQKLTPQVISIVQNIHSHVVSGLDAGNSSNPGLDFLKVMTETLMVDQASQHVVLVLKRQCLKVLGVKEFSPEDEKTLMSRTFVLQDVLCRSCNTVQDLDLFKDKVDGEWPCAACGAHFERDDVEVRLVEGVQRDTTSFQVQDLLYNAPGRSAKEMKIDNMGETKDIDESMPRTTIMSRFAVLLHIAEENAFEYLKGSLSWFV
jgi:DNA polymerase epsilon subunit 1